MVCPMKFALNNCNDYSCNEEKCAWWCQNLNGEGECAIHALPSLYDAIEDVATQIVQK